MADYDDEDLDQSEAIKQALASALALRKNTSAPQGQMIGNGGFQHYVAPHWSQQLAPALNNVLAGYDTYQAQQMNKKQKAAQQAEMEMAIAAMPKRQEAVPGVPATEPIPETLGAYGVNMPAVEGTPEVAPIEAKEPTTDEWAKWYMRLGKNPLTKSMAKTGMDEIVKQPGREADRRVKYAQMDRTQLIAEAKLGNALAIQELKNQGLLGVAGIKSDDSRARDTSNEKIAGINQEGKVQVANINAGAQNYRANKTYEAALAKIQGAGAKPMSDKQLQTVSEMSSKNALMDGQLEDFDEMSDILVGLRNAGLNAGSKTWVIDSMLKSMGVDTDKRVKAADWWKTFYSTENIDRHSLFGSALTEGERKEWAKTTINEASSKEAIRERLLKRQEIARKAMDRYTTMAGMNKQQALAYAREQGLGKEIDAHVGKITQKGGGAPTPASTTAPTGGGAPGADGWVDAGGGLRYRVK